MDNSVYTVNKGINQSIEFKGLKAQYIWILGGGLVGLLLLFAILYIVGANTYLCIVLVMGAGAILVIKVYKMSRSYGEYGMMKKLARKALPTAIKVRSRKVFLMDITEENSFNQKHKS